VGAIGGCFLYGKFCKLISLKRSLFWAVGLNSLNILITLAIVNRFSAIVLSVAGGVFGYLSLLPLMGSAAVLSRQKGIEGSLFALIMSVFNLGQILSTFMGGKLFDIIGLTPLIILSAGLGLVGFFFVGRLKTLGRE
jgi:predicted MFS family arabinose efflux permease